jgi:hypothetical protein
MEPHRNIVHNSKIHIEFYVKTYVSMCLCGSKLLEVKLFRLSNRIKSSHGVLMAKMNGA